MLAAAATHARALGLIGRHVVIGLRVIPAQLLKSIGAVHGASCLVPFWP
jgi:hypothetical protein